ncbi:sulfur oxidation protein SoxX [Thioalkalivibrio versutus]|uniref:Sulfur oxidation protein SoxX n=1 Tax=Thioalkalivibrio versutus TaxID=106634 RepID=A0A0G3G8T3_9GAMM|nr:MULTISPECIES: sulfur oxidation c-type cytochrome SoxX [Thioalkalivibrio]AKJ95987.1 sulfur oxidation protein SoxX [Thioalkalivibrio versutus]OOC50075.1 sulfur oxidation c-type cytochrome SoxX [Thioalkalivibrio versutus]
MFKKNAVAAGMAAFASVALAAGCAVADGSKGSDVDITAMSADELAEHLIFETDSFRDQEMQEGGSWRDRMTQDELQKACSMEGDPDGETAGRVVAMARAGYERPEGGVELGDWRKGAELANSGYGYRQGHNTDNHGQREAGGNCYNCHVFDPRVSEQGTIGPSLQNYGANRGTSEAVLNYVHEVISNPHQYFPCTQMPRFNSDRHQLLSDEQISHIMAYLLDPESPVNNQ